MSETQTLPPLRVVPETNATMLFVDDEANILSSLKRLFRPFGYRILTAESGAEGLEIMEREAVDLVVSDMRMPEMNGVQFLEKVRKKWPETVRMLLTGHTEIGTTIDAINKGQIYRYLSKPWQDSDIIPTIRHAVHQQMLEREKQRLEELTHRQNEELKDLNANLEEKVKARTEEVRRTMELLEIAHSNLKKSFVTSIQVFSNLIELREGDVAGHSRRVAALSRMIAQRMGMSEAEVQDVFIAALLHDIGKIGLPDRLFEKPFVNLTGEERAEVIKHPVKGQIALMALEQLHAAAKLIRSQRERFDGLGYPDGLGGADIPLGARILALVYDYNAAQIGKLLSKRLSPSEAAAYIQEGKGKRYDPAVVDAFISVTKVKEASFQTESELIVNSRQLKPGMILSRDFLTAYGAFMLAKDCVLNETLIMRIRKFESEVGNQLIIYIHAQK